MHVMIHLRDSPLSSRISFSLYHDFLDNKTPALIHQAIEYTGNIVCLPYVKGMRCTIGFALIILYYSDDMEK